MTDSNWLNVDISTGVAPDGCLAILIEGAQVHPTENGGIEVHLGAVSMEAILASKSAFNEAFENLIRQVSPLN